MPGGTLTRMSAFSTTPAGGNPAGVWIGDELPPVEEMQRIATAVGFSETAFLAPARGPERIIRYYSPLAEVGFCGHATIASGVVLGETDGDGDYRLSTRAGVVPVSVRSEGGVRQAALTSVEPKQAPAPPALVAAVLDCLGWQPADLDPRIPPAKAYAGIWHLVLAAREAARLATLVYDFDRLQRVMLDADLTTLQLVWRAEPGVFHSRNPFPVGGVVEDPATGAAAAALGGYMRAAGLVTPPARLTIHQGEAMGRPSLLRVDIPPAGGIVVSGAAVRLPEGGR